LAGRFTPSIDASRRVLRGGVVRSGAVVEQAVLDERVEIGAGVGVGGPSDDVALVGMGACSARETTWPPVGGSRGRGTTDGRPAGRLSSLPVRLRPRTVLERVGMTEAGPRDRTSVTCSVPLGVLAQDVGDAGVEA